ncbi:geranylgeranyl transferase type-2 subunit beta [Pycnococcus provasolii]
MASHQHQDDDLVLAGGGGLLVDLHASYLATSASVEASTTVFELAAASHLRMSGAYWGLCALSLIRKTNAMDTNALVEWVASCQHSDSGGFGADTNHDAHILYTLSAVQILAIVDRMDAIDVKAAADYVAARQCADGSFTGDEWGERDTRFSYCAVSCLALLGRLDAIDVDAATTHVMSCMNFDGGFGCVPGGESHAGQVFTGVGALSIIDPQLRMLSEAQKRTMAAWLAERQTSKGGFNGRPEKLPDVCYSWWVLSALACLGKLHYVDGSKLRAFVLGCQNDERGGISDRPDDEADVYHTFFGIAGLSLLGLDTDVVDAVDARFALPEKVVERILLR